MAEQLLNIPESYERSSSFKRALGMAAVRATAVIALFSSAITVGSRTESDAQDPQAQSIKSDQSYVLVDNAYDDYNSVANPEEKSWCRWPSRWPLCNMAMRDLGNEALASAEYVASTNGWSVHNGKADAFRHCFWSGLMTRHMGPDTAEGFGDRHEYGEVEPEFERSMDLTNNEIGRQVGMGQGSVYNRCLEDARNGVLVAFEN
jgi:hypothetical protein